MEDFIIEVSPEAAVRAKTLPTGKYLFTVKDVERAMDMQTEEEMTAVTVECLHPDFKGWTKVKRFLDGAEDPTKDQVRFFEGCGVDFSDGKTKKVSLSQLKGTKFYATVQKVSDERFGLFNRFNEYFPYQVTGAPDEDDEDDE